MDNNNKYNYDDMEAIAVNVVKILLRGNVPMEDIMHISGKTEEEIIKIKENEQNQEKEINDENEKVKVGE